MAILRTLTAGAVLLLTAATLLPLQANTVSSYLCPPLVQANTTWDIKATDGTGFKQFYITFIVLSYRFQDPTGLDKGSYRPERFMPLSTDGRYTWTDPHMHCACTRYIVGNQTFVQVTSYYAGGVAIPYRDPDGWSDDNGGGDGSGEGGIGGNGGSEFDVGGGALQEYWNKLTDGMYCYATSEGVSCFNP